MVARVHAKVAEPSIGTGLANDKQRNAGGKIFKISFVTAQDRT